MRDVALTAAILTGAFFMAPIGSAVSATSVLTSGDGSNIHTIINKPDNADAATVATAESPTRTKDPARANLAAANKESTPAPANQSKTVTVQPGDTLTAVATNNGVTYTRLYDANPAVDNPDLIYPGQELRVPAANEELASRPLPANAPAAAVAEAADTTSASQASDYTAPAPRPVVSSAPAVAGGSVWDALAQCEAGGNWAINTGNGFYGGLQFTLSSWAAAGGSGMPNQASREEQIMRGQILQSMQGWGAWPACSAKLGLY